MKRNSSGLTGANAASIVGLKAILAQEKAARAGKATSTPSPTTQSLTSNKGVNERAKRDELPQEPSSKPKKVTYIGGVAYVQGEDDWEPLVDTERKQWEEYERSRIWESRGPEAQREAWEESNRREEEEEALKKLKRRELMEELAQDTEKERDEVRTQIAKRQRDKMARLELIQSKAAKSKVLNPESAYQTESKDVIILKIEVEEGDKEVEFTSNGGSPKKPKLEEMIDKET